MTFIFFIWKHLTRLITHNDYTVFTVWEYYSQLITQSNSNCSCSKWTNFLVNYNKTGSHSTLCIYIMMLFNDLTKCKHTSFIATMHTSSYHNYSKSPRALPNLDEVCIPGQLSNTIKGIWNFILFGPPSPPLPSPPFPPLLSSSSTLLCSCSPHTQMYTDPQLGPCSLSTQIHTMGRISALTGKPSSRGFTWIHRFLVTKGSRVMLKLSAF